MIGSSFLFAASKPLPEGDTVSSKAVGYAKIPCGSAGKESACNAGDLGSILG